MSFFLQDTAFLPLFLADRRQVQRHAVNVTCLITAGQWIWCLRHSFSSFPGSEVGWLKKSEVRCPESRCVSDWQVCNRLVIQGVYLPRWPSVIRGEDRQASAEPRSPCVPPHTPRPPPRAPRMWQHSTDPDKRQPPVFTEPCRFASR